MEVLSSKFERVLVGCEYILDRGVESGAGFGYLTGSFWGGGKGSR